MTSIDVSIFTWLSKISAEDLIKYKIENDRVDVTVTNSIAANALWKSQYHIAPLRLRILIHSRLYAESDRAPLLSYISHGGAASMLNRIHNLSSQWLRNPINQSFLSLIESPCIVYSTDSDGGYRVKAIKEWMHPKKFNRSVDFLLSDGGQPLSVWDEAIALPRQRLMEEAIATGIAQREAYEHVWNGLVWSLEHNVIPLQTGEVLVAVSDLKDWQKNADMWNALAVG